MRLSVQTRLFRYVELLTADCTWTKICWRVAHRDVLFMPEMRRFWPENALSARFVGISEKKSFLACREEQIGLKWSYRII
jgi:hypothetical protein